ncbi:MAG: NADH-quinone oxidoreductase subunit A [Geodermatophilaceae bacterium]
MALVRQLPYTPRGIPSLQSRAGESTRSGGWILATLGAAFVVLVATAALVLALYAVNLLVSISRHPVVSDPFLSGHAHIEHAVSRYHARWYPVTLLFLAFDMEMVFMYPWALVVADIGVKAVVEMFGFLVILFVGVVYAWREGALRWA